MHSHDYDSLVEAQQGVRADGYKEEFIWKDGSFMDEAQSKSYQPSDLIVVENYRFEGMSNPGDMSILMVLEANDGKKGYTMSGYGTYADEKFVKFLDEVPQREDPHVEKTP